MITHVVVFWADEEKQEKLLEGVATLGEIPGVSEFRYGRAIPSPRAVVDDTFAVSISMSFPDQATAEAYQAHPLHEEFVEQYVKPLVSRFVVYDFG